VRLSKGTNLKDGRSDFVLCESDTRNDDDVDLEAVDTVQNVRAVWNGDEWDVQFVCKEMIETPETSGDGVAGVDLGVSNIAAVAFPDEYVLYPGNPIKQDNHYFHQQEYNTPPKVRMARHNKLSDHVRNASVVRRISTTLSRRRLSTSV
jgi:Probable transposase.